MAVTPLEFVHTKPLRPQTDHKSWGNLPLGLRKVRRDPPWGVVVGVGGSNPIRVRKFGGEL